MTVRQRSPTNNFNVTLPEDPMAFQTIRGRNPDGSTTVYHVHESVIHGGGGGSTMYFGDNSSNNSMMYGTQQAYSTPYAGQVNSHQQYQQPHQPQPYIVYAQRKNEVSEDESSDEEEETHAISPIAQSTSNGQRKKFMKHCNRTSIPCVLMGILMAISFIVGYVLMVESIVNRSRTATSSTTSAVHSQRQRQKQQHDTMIERTSGNENQSRSDTGNQQPLAEVAQLLNLEPQYFVVNKVLQPVNVAEVVPPPQMSGEVGQPRSMSTATTTTDNIGGAANIGAVEQQQKRQQQLRGIAVHPKSPNGITINSKGIYNDVAELESQKNLQIIAQQSELTRRDDTASTGLQLSHNMSDPVYPIGDDGPV